MDPIKSKADAVSLAVVAVLNALSGFVGLPSWATAEGVMLANGAVVANLLLIRFVAKKVRADTIAQVKQQNDVI